MQPRHKSAAICGRPSASIRAGQARSKHSRHPVQISPSTVIGARRAWRRIEADLDRWEQELESETMALCQDVLGIEVGDIVITESAGKPLRLTVEGMTVFISDSGVIFSLWGTRFRKDGSPGKRTEHFAFQVEDDLERVKMTGQR